MMKILSGGMALALTGAVASAQPVPKLKTISHEYLQRGATAQVTIEAENISPDAKFLLSDDAGLTLTLVPPAQPTMAVESSLGGVSTVAKPDPGKITATLAIAANAALGNREVRVATAGGVSNPVNFIVSHLPEANGAAAATSRDAAQAVSLPVAITAKINGAAESDFYKFGAKAGQRIVFEVVAQRLGSALDSSLAILDAAGRELARNEDAIGNDSVLEFVVPADGEFFAQVRDYRMQGGDNFKYRLLAGAMPFVRAAFPHGGRRGETVEVELRGHNLEGAERMTLRLDADAPTGQQELRAASAAGLSNPFPFVVTDLPQSFDAEPNTSITHANAVSLPAAINGRIQAAKDYDAYRFHAEKGQRFIFEVAAQRFGSPLDALLTLTDGRGNVLQRNDDANGPDARLDQTFAEAGDYVLIIEDLLERGGPEFTYRISCTQPVGDFEVRFVTDTPRVARGGRAPVRCEITRLNNFSEPIRISAVGLGAGLHAEPLILTAKDPAAGLLFISASGSAPLGPTEFRIEASSASANRTPSRAAKPFALDRPVAKAHITVLSEAPFMIYPGQLLATVEQDQTINLEALLERGKNFQGEVKISLEGFSAGREPVTKSFDYQPVAIKPNETRASIPVKARLDSEIGARMMVLRGDATVDGQAVTQFSTPFPVATSQIPFVLSTTLKRLTLTAVAPGGESSAGEGFFLVRAERRAGFGGEVTLQIEGVPEGITATAEKIAAGAGEATVKFVASEKAPVGKETQLTITGVGVFNDKTYRFKPQTIALLVNAPEPAEVKTAAAKPTESPAGASK